MSHIFTMSNLYTVTVPTHGPAHVQFEMTMNGLRVQVLEPNGMFFEVPFPPNIFSDIVRSTYVPQCNYCPCGRPTLRPTFFECPECFKAGKQERLNAKLNAATAKKKAKYVKLV